MDLSFVARAVLVGLVGVMAFILSQHIVLANAARDLGVDFAVFARAARASPELVYQASRAPFAYPPTALVLLKPLTLLGYWFWAAFSVAVFAIPVAMVTGKRIAALSLLTPPVLKGLVQGQLSLLLGGLLFLGLAVPPLLGGALWGVAATIKPQMVIFAPLALIARRDWTMLRGMALGICLMLIASLFLPLSLWLGWTQALSGFNGMIQHGLMTKVISPAGQAVLAGLPALPFVIGGLALGSAAVFYLAPKVDGAELIALVTAASIVTSPYAHLYDSTALIPACLMLLTKGRWVYAVPAGFIVTGLLGPTSAALVFVLGAALVSSLRSVTGLARRRASEPSP